MSFLYLYLLAAYHWRKRMVLYYNMPLVRKRSLPPKDSKQSVGRG